MNDIKDSVLNKIKCGEVTMRPRWHFVALSAFAALGLLLLALWLVYLESFIFFVLMGTGMAFIPLFGVKGVLVFLLSAPWLLLLLTIVFMFVLHRFMHRYAFCYSKPVLYSILAVVALSVLAAIPLAKSDFHYAMLERMEERKLPVISTIYKQYGHGPLREVHVGVVSSTTQTGYIIESRTGGEYRVLIRTNTKIPHEQIELGDSILILGPDEDGVIEAHGVRPFREREIRSPEARPGAQVIQPFLREQRPLPERPALEPRSPVQN